MPDYQKIKILYSLYLQAVFLAVFVEVAAKKRYNISYEIMQFLQYRSANTQIAYMVMCIAERI